MAVSRVGEVSSEIRILSPQAVQMGYWGLGGSFAYVEHVWSIALKDSRSINGWARERKHSMKHSMSAILIFLAASALGAVASEVRPLSSDAVANPVRSIACQERPVRSLLAIPGSTCVAALTPSRCLILEVSHGVVAHTNGIQSTCAAPSPSGKEIAVAEDDSGSTFRSGPFLIRDGRRTDRTVGGSVCILSTTTNEPLRAFPAASFTISAMAYTPDGKSLATASARVTQTPNAGGGWTAIATEGEVVLWDPTTGSEKGRFIGQESLVHALAFSASGGILAGAGYKPQHVMLWDVVTRQQMGLLTHPGREIKSLAFAKRDSVVLGASSGGGIQIWDIERRTHLATIPTEECRSIAVSPDGLHILAAVDGGTARMWNLDTYACVRTWTKEQTGWAVSATFTADGDYVAIGGDDGVVRIWSASSVATSQP